MADEVDDQWDHLPKATEMTDKPTGYETQRFEGAVPESWCCIDCGMNTAPGMLNRADIEKAAKALGEKWRAGEGITQTLDADTEIFSVRDAVWHAAGMVPMGGCLCIRCLRNSDDREQLNRPIPSSRHFDPSRAACRAPVGACA